MKHNDFDPSDRQLYDEYQECWWCKKTRADCLHHICGRGGGGDSEVESSILNSAPFCNQSCHLPNHGLITTKEWKKKLLNKTFEFLERRGYQLNSNDEKFLEKYSHLY